MAGPLRVAVLLSGAGTTCDALADALGRDGAARIVLVLADRPGTAGVALAERRGLATEVVPHPGPADAAWAQRVDAQLAGRDVALVVLAGFLARLPAAFVDRWAGRIVNVHPSLLPAYGGPGWYGDRVHAAVLADGRRTTGATVHVVTAEVDAGPVLLQATVPVRTDDDLPALRARVRAAERRLLAEAVVGFAAGRWPLPYPV